MKSLVLAALAIIAFAGCQTAGRNTTSYPDYSPPASVDYGGAVSAGAGSGSCPSCR